MIKVKIKRKKKTKEKRRRDLSLESDFSRFGPRPSARPTADGTFFQISFRKSKRHTRETRSAVIGQDIVPTSSLK